ncbi:MAG: ComF family protein [Rhizobiales bacterium]|nr:ComF family protein [Hyphomicrobiales bacterium]
MDWAVLCSDGNGWVKVAAEAVSDDIDTGAEPVRLDLRRAGRMVSRWLCDFLAPPHCLVCRAAIVESASLCSACWGLLRFIEEPCCPRLGIPFPYDPGFGQTSAAALADPPPWMRSRSAVAYDEASKPIVHALKYRDRHEAATLMTRLMARAGAQFLGECDLVIPVPLHPLRLWRRRFNQAAMIAQRLCADRPEAFQPLILKRARATRPQVGLDHEARRKNVRGAFIVAERDRIKVGGRRVLLVDDVMTTGATASACTQALQKAGARSVDILTFALVLEPRRLHI